MHLPQEANPGYAAARRTLDYGIERLRRKHLATELQKLS
jgi:hypothetical protein